MVAAGSAVAAAVSCLIADGVAADGTLAVGWVVVGIGSSCSHLR